MLKCDVEMWAECMVVVGGVLFNDRHFEYTQITCGLEYMQLPMCIIQVTVAP
jgi:hypothetical protein